MSTFINAAKVRELAASGDALYKGAAWILDQLDAARVDLNDYDDRDEWTRQAPTGQ